MNQRGILVTRICSSNKNIIVYDQIDWHNMPHTWRKSCNELTYNYKKSDNIAGYSLISYCSTAYQYRNFGNVNCRDNSAYIQLFLKYEKVGLSSSLIGYVILCVSKTHDLHKVWRLCVSTSQQYKKIKSRAITREVTMLILRTTGVWCIYLLIYANEKNCQYTPGSLLFK